MKSFLSVLLCFAVLSAVVSAQAPAEKKRFILYAQFLEDTPVELSTGAKWVMDKGDCFPIYMFKEQRTKVILQLGDATFRTDASKVRVLPESESGAAFVSYKKNFDAFMKSLPEDVKKELKRKQKEKEKAQEQAAS